MNDYALFTREPTLHVGKCAFCFAVRTVRKYLDDTAINVGLQPEWVDACYACIPRCQSR